MRERCHYCGQSDKPLTQSVCASCQYLEARYERVHRPEGASNAESEEAQAAGLGVRDGNQRQERRESARQSRKEHGRQDGRKVGRQNGRKVLGR